jgi:hypothetical protein
VPRQVFCFVDFLGSVAYNNARGEQAPASTRKAVRFIKEYFPHHYREYANLLVAMWRHGTVHGFLPYKYYALQGRRKITVRWSSNNDFKPHNRAVNLKLFDVQGDPNSVCLAINICELADDLFAALDKIIRRIDRDPSFERACVRRLNRVLKPRYIKAKGLRVAGKAEIEAQILAAPGSTSGLLRGDQVEWY